MNTCSIKDAMNLCVEIYKVLSPHGYYPALTGGLLYKGPERKDIDIVIYANRQMHTNFKMIDIDELLLKVGFTNIEYYGFVTKTIYNGFVVDLLNPEDTGDY